MQRQKLRSVLQDRHVRELFIGSFFSLGGKVFAVGFGLGLNFFVARFYGSESLGVLAIIMSVTTVASLFALGGANTAVMKLLPEHFVRYSASSAWHVFLKLIGFVLLHSVVVSGLLWLIAEPLAYQVFHKPYVSDLLEYCALFLIFYSVGRLCLETLRPLKAIKVYSVSQVLPSGIHFMLLLVATVWWFSDYAPIHSYFATSVLLSLLMFGIVFSRFRKVIGPGQRVERTSWRSIYGLSLPMLLTASMTVIIGNIDILMLGAIRSESEVGVYQVVVKIGLLASFILQTINVMAGPKFSELYHSGKKSELARLAQQSTKMIFWATAPVIAGIVFLGPWLLKLFGEEYITGYTALIFLAMGQFVNAISGSVGYYLNMTGSHKVFRNIMLAAAVVNICLNRLLIPDWGIEGAAFASMVSLVLWNLACVTFIWMKDGFVMIYFPVMRER